MQATRRRWRDCGLISSKVSFVVASLLLFTFSAAPSHHDEPQRRRDLLVRRERGLQEGDKTATTLLADMLGRVPASTQALIRQRLAAQEPGLKKHPRQLSDVYIPRGKVLDTATKNKLAQKWGAWNLIDSKGSQRPTDDFFAHYSNRDVPANAFPANAWQRDTDYLSKFVPEAKALVRRAMEAILTEYGHGPDDEPGKSFEERSDMFALTFVEELPRSAGNKGGYTTEKSYNGLVRRILHAIMTEDRFVLALGGHSSAAGHGNLFQQAYVPQFQKVMEPVFARLGVHCISRSIAYGGMGTLQTALGSASILGSDIDVLVWDSGMTEPDAFGTDLFLRQGLLAGTKVPILWGGKNNLLNVFLKEADADVGMPGTSFDGIPTTEAPELIEKIPWASRYIECSSQMRAECREKGYWAGCWVERSDFTPPKNQLSKTAGRAKWHPGDKSHQLKGRTLAFTVLLAMERALTVWANTENFLLPDEAWHVTDYYKNIQEKTRTIPQDKGNCYNNGLSDRVCHIPLQGRTEYTPRANPEWTSLRSIAKNEAELGPVQKNAYDPPDVPNPYLQVPDGVFDYLDVVENGVDFVPTRGQMEYAAEQSKVRVISAEQKYASSKITQGKGWILNQRIGAPDNCDGTYDSFCAREETTSCLFYGHADDRGGLMFDGLSGWGVFNLKGLTHGIIIVNMEHWLQSGENKKTEGWTCENNVSSCKRRELESSSAATEHQHHEGARELGGKKPVPPYCDEFKFEFAIDGKVTTWDLHEFQSRERDLQRMVKAWKLLDDENFTKGKPRDVEVAIRITGCQRIKTFRLTHLYWA